MTKYIRKWSPEGEKKGCVIVIHGLGEHSGRYNNFANYLNGRGFQVYAMDLPGHGDDEGKRGHVKQFEEFFQTCGKMSRTAKMENPKLPLFLFGHSLGGLIALRYLERNEDPYNASAVSAPALQNFKEQLGILFYLVKPLVYIMPWATMGNRIDPGDLSSNPEAVERYKEDPRVHDRISLKLFSEMNRNINEAWNQIANVKTPLLLLCGEEDRVVSTRAINEFYDKLPIKDKKIVSFVEGKHELFEDKRNQDAFFKEIADFFSAHL
ncbi:MAG: lysophospholipase [Kosmotoga sp.]|nr:MAG: lysophospholipase [Kosmotoga sp.]